MPTQYATAKELESFKQTVAQCERIESDVGLNAAIQDRGEFNKRKKDAQTAIDTRQAPAPKSDEERTNLRHRQTLLEAFIKLDCPEIGKPEMPSQHEMWDTPAGAVGKQRRWDHATKNYTLDPNGNPIPAKAGYGAIFEWKDNQRKLRGAEEEWDGDIANVETLRPQNRDNSSFADYRKMHFAGTPAFKANFDEVFPDHAPTPVEAKIEQKKDAPVHCAGTKATGKPCESYPKKGSKYCRIHQIQEILNDDVEQKTA
jgi:hypothetical protein